MPRSGGTSNLSMSHLIVTGLTLRSRPHHHQTLPSLRERAPKIFVEGTALGETRMSRNSARVLALVLGSLILPAQSFAQLTPPRDQPAPAIRRSAASRSDPPIPECSLTTAASEMPHAPAAPRQPPAATGVLRIGQFVTAVAHTLLAPPYAGASQRIISAHDVEPRSKARGRRRGRTQVSTFPGICRGC